MRGPLSTLLRVKRARLDIGKCRFGAYGLRPIDTKRKNDAQWPRLELTSSGHLPPQILAQEFARHSRSNRVLTHRHFAPAFWHS